MIHEVLLALHGCPGDLFIIDNTNGKLVVSPDIPFLHDSERAQLNQLLELAQLYMHLESCTKHPNLPLLAAVKSRYIASGSGSASTSTDHVHQNDLRHAARGVYHQALYMALNEYLNGYRKQILLVERKVLDYLDPDTNGGRTPLTFVNVTFAQFHLVFVHLSDLVHQVESNLAEYHGAKILSLLHHKCNTGLPAVRQAMLQLQHACLGVMYRQITTWMIYGELNDPYAEFFIRKNAEENSIEAGADLTPTVIDLHESRTRWHSEYMIHHHSTPPFMSTRVAENVLFVGKAISTIRESPTINNQQVIRTISTTFLTDFVALSRQQVYKDAELEVLVEKVKTHVSRTLWKAVVVDGHVSRHFKAFKDFYLLGKGEFYVSFLDGCDVVRQQAAARLSLVTEYDMDNLWKKTARDTTAEHDPAVDCFAFKFVKPDERATGSIQSLFESELVHLPLRLEYAATWPLDLILTRLDMDKYNALFTFLVYLKKVQMRIQRIWSLTNAAARGSASGSGLDSDTRPREQTSTANLTRVLWSVRARMMFFIDHLWSYVQMDVLESQYGVLALALRNDDGSLPCADSESAGSDGSPGCGPQEAGCDFEALQCKHHVYLDAIYTGCFLDDSASSASLRGVIKTLLDVSVRFCGVVEDALRSGRLGDHAVQRVESLRREFDDSCQFLFNALAGAKFNAGRNDGSVSFEKLLLRMDYNRWFTVGSDLNADAVNRSSYSGGCGGGLVG
ncbi:hypothetical protein SeMB42_g02440 [Synchytrium endobioticum]|uniref:Spindle pole body component n=1 Tax=Synchytrium endobioticum TaxID=286115 RepID=A0A507D7S4_9FUNG|nr:hypothetical protein SeLEV6574_g02655 [Synchytrium endobioticum]TPX49885.1 hypothetical protein SeMB42_g02440 [Synchytrium endobioticum]